MGLTQLTAEMDSIPHADEAELRLELDQDLSADSPAPWPQTSVAAAATAQPQDPADGHSGDPAPDPLQKEQAQEEPVAAPLVPAAAVLQDALADPPASPAAPADSATQPAALSPWQTPLSSLRAMIAGRLQTRQSVAKTAPALQAALLPSPDRPTSPLSVHQLHGGNEDAHESVPVAVAATAAPATSPTMAAQPCSLRSADVSELVGGDVADILMAAQNGELMDSRPLKRRRTAREVVCEFFGLKDSHFQSASVI